MSGESPLCEFLLSLASPFPVCSPIFTETMITRDETLPWQRWTKAKIDETASRVN